MRQLVVVACLVLIAAACSSSSASSGSSSSSSSSSPSGSSKPTEPYPAPPNPMELARKAGLVPETHETLFHHVHAHLDYFIDGNPIIVPPGIGIDITNPAVKKKDNALIGYPAYGSIDPPCDRPCISPLHTHYAD